MFAVLEAKDVVIFFVNIKTELHKGLLIRPYFVPNYLYGDPYLDFVNNVLREVFEVCLHMLVFSLPLPHFILLFLE